MRSVNKKEKDIINYIVENTKQKQKQKQKADDSDISDNNLLDIICSYRDCSKEDIKYNIEKKQLWLDKIDPDTKNELTSTSINVRPVAEVISFLEYLEKMNFIVFLNYNADIGNDTSPNEHEEKHFQEVYDEPLKKFFFKNIRSGIFATQHLIDYKDNGYKTVEQRMHDEEIETMQRIHDEEIETMKIMHIKEIKTMKEEITWAKVAVGLALVGIILNAILIWLKKP